MTEQNTPNNHPDTPTPPEPPRDGGEPPAPKVAEQELSQVALRDERAGRERSRRRRAGIGKFFSRWGLHLVLAAVSFTLVLPFVWMLCTSIKPLSQVGVGSWLPRPRSIIKPQDITNPQALLDRVSGGEAVAKFLRSQFPGSLQDQLQTRRSKSKGQSEPKAEAEDSTLLAAVRGQLNNLIQANTPIYDAQAFASVQLPDAQKKLLKVESTDGESFTDYQTHRLNRLLLESAFDGTLGAAPAMQLGNYFDVFREIPFARYYWNSLFVAGAITFLKVFTSAMAAFAFARLQWPGRDKVFLLYLGTMMLPGLVMMIPNYQIMIYLGLVDTMIGLILPAAFTAFGTFLLRQFMLTIPTSLDEAAQIDGASKWRVYWDVILPLARPGLITLAIFVFIQSYHSFFWPLVMLKSQYKYTLPIGLLYFDSSQGQETNLLMAGVAMSIIPLVIVFVIMQKYLVKGIQLGAVKG